MLTLAPDVRFSTGLASDLLFLLLWFLLCLSDLVDPVGLLERAFLRDVVGLLTQDECGDCLQ